MEVLSRGVIGLAVLIKTTQAATWRMDCQGQRAIRERGRPAGIFLQTPEGLIGVQ